MEKISIGEIKSIHPVFMNGSLADNVEEVKVRTGCSYYKFIVGKGLYKKNNTVIILFNGCKIKYSKITEKYCKTKRGNPKEYVVIKSRNFNNITDSEGNPVDYVSEGVLIKYGHAALHLQKIYQTGFISINNIKSYIVSGSINLKDNENGRKKLYTRARNFLKRIIRKNF